jgi:phospholipid/cholesterol/gamma-HCH transport system substrate-binding protein
MKEQTAETILGAIVAAVAIGFFAFASAQSGRGETRGGYDLFARFQRVDGIAVGSDVRVSGVKVGAVRAMALDPETYMAKLTLTIDRDVQVLDQSTARVQSNGLLGDAYVSIEPAGVDALQAGGEIANTQGAVDLLTLLASAVGNLGAASGENSP